MNDDPKRAMPGVKTDDSLLVLGLLALAVGAVAGFVGATFRLALAHADRLRDALIAWAQGEKLAGFVLVVVTCAAATSVAAWLVRRFSPHASGSGIPHVEAVLNEELPQAPFRLVWVKFVGGLLAIGSGLALGREGPTVQMGASIGHCVGRLFRRNWPDCRVLLAAGAGAGLATAFNAPVAGAIFVLEELVRRFELRIAIAALGASATAIGVASVLLGDAPDFRVGALAYASGEVRPLFFVLGALAGLAAIAYNRTLLATIAAAERLERLSVELRAGLIGAAVGTLAWFAPGLVGGGDAITQQALAGAEMLAVLPLAFLLRFGLGSLSYAAGTPGGLFAPMLVLGAQLGLLFGLVCRLVFPGLDIQVEGFAVVGMAAFFTGVVRAPLTAIVLVTEMTASMTMLLPMLAACFAAMLVPTLLRDPPIYDSLREHTLHRDRMVPRKPRS
jgi:chloride channel protein, CIC family